MSAAAYATIYIEILVVCAGYSLIILQRTTVDLGTNLEVNVFKWFLRIFTIMLFADGFTQLQYNDVIHPPLITVALGYATYQFMLCVLAVLWLLFAWLQITGALPPKPAILLGCVLPLFAMGVMAYGTIWTGWLFTFNETGHFVRGPYFIVLMFFAYLYFIITTAHAFICYSKETSQSRKRRLRLVASFIVPPTIGAAFQIFVGQAPFVPPSICIAFIYIFVNIQSDLVNADALTGLNNRKSMEKYMDEIRPHVSELNSYYFYLADADRFKSINDTYGHIEGDHALRCIADALKATGATFRGCFIARYGGDEFIAIIDGKDLLDPEAFPRATRENLERICKEKEKPYPLSVSIGCCRFASPETSISELIAKADQELYELKKIAHGVKDEP